VKTIEARQEPRPEPQVPQRGAELAQRRAREGLAVAEPVDHDVLVEPVLAQDPGDVEQVRDVRDVGSLAYLAGVRPRREREGLVEARRKAHENAGR
jgi:hypothetical protein